MFILSCPVCNENFQSSTQRRKYCTQQCKDKGKPSASGLSCCVCGDSMQKSRTSRPQGEAMHNKCMPGGGLGIGHRKGCSCADCKAVMAARNQRRIQAVRAEHGVNPSTLYRRKFKADTGVRYWAGPSAKDWIAPVLRLELYERDSFICHLCGLEVERDGDPNGDFAPSLDHIIPRIHGGSDDPSNLSTAHRLCNSRKGVSLQSA